MVVRANRKSADTRLPGTPRVKVGISVPPSLASLEASGAMTPRTSPLPKVSLAPLQVWAA